MVRCLGACQLLGHLLLVSVVAWGDCLLLMFLVVQVCQSIGIRLGHWCGGRHVVNDRLGSFHISIRLILQVENDSHMHVCCELGRLCAGSCCMLDMASGVDWIVYVRHMVEIPVPCRLLGWQIQGR